MLTVNSPEVVKYVEVVTSTYNTYMEKNFPRNDRDIFETKETPNYIKVTHKRPGDRFGGAVHSFVARRDFTTKDLGQVKAGDILYPGGWKGPARHARGNVFLEPSAALTHTGSVRTL